MDFAGYQAEFHWVLGFEERILLEGFFCVRTSGSQWILEDSRWNPSGFLGNPGGIQMDFGGFQVESQWVLGLKERILLEGVLCVGMGRIPVDLGDSRWNPNEFWGIPGRLSVDFGGFQMESQWILGFEESILLEGVLCVGKGRSQWILRNSRWNHNGFWGLKRGSC